MNDYTRGAFESLSWVKIKLEDLKPEKLDELKGEVAKTLEDISKIAAMDFRDKFRRRAELTGK